MKKAKGEKIITIPEFYFSRMVKVGDRFDMYHNAEAMGKYYGVDTIEIFPIGFDYAQIDKAPSIITNINFAGSISLKKIMFYSFWSI